VVVGEVGRLRDDVADLLQVFDAAFGSIAGYDRAARACNRLFDLYGALVAILERRDASRTSRKRSSERPLGYIVKLSSSNSPCEPTSMLVSSMATVGSVVVWVWCRALTKLSSRKRNQHGSVGKRERDNPHVIPHQITFLPDFVILSELIRRGNRA
jgi:hypothetical protein